MQDRIRREASLDASVKTWVVQKYIERPLVIHNRYADGTPQMLQGIGLQC